MTEQAHPNRFRRLAARLWWRTRYMPTWIRYGRGGVGWGLRLMSWIRKRWVLFLHPHATIVFEGPVYLGPRFSLQIPKNGTFIVGPGVEFRRGFRAEIVRDGRITIGAGSYLTYDVVLSTGTSIEIGERVGIGQAAYITDGNHRYRDLDKPMLAQGYDWRPITIGDDVSIFSKCTITNSVGTRSAIGANSMVTKEVPPYCLAAGVPARVIEYFGPPGQEPPEVAEGLKAGDGATSSPPSPAETR